MGPREAALRSQYSGGAFRMGDNRIRLEQAIAADNAEALQLRAQDTSRNQQALDAADAQRVQAEQQAIIDSINQQSGMASQPNIAQSASYNNPMAQQPMGPSTLSSVAASNAITPSPLLTNAQGGDFLISPASRADGSYQTIDALIQGRTPEALNILNTGNAQQLGLQQAATQSGLQPLRQIDDLRAFDEQQSLLGLRGQEAQEQAIGGIPISQFDQELQNRQQKQLQRAAAARGELGGGATFEAGAQLAGAQQANIIQNRLGQLEPLVALSRGVRSDMSGQLESGAVREANIQQGLGVQQGNIRLGSTAPIIQGIKSRAEISGLQGISSAQQKAQTNNQLASLAGSFFG